MPDEFFTKRKCDRCGGSLDGGRTMSMFDTSCICMACAAAEREHPDYRRAADAELAEVRKCNRNFKGIGFDGGKAGKS